MKEIEGLRETRGSTDWCDLMMWCDFMCLWGSTKEGLRILYFIFYKNKIYTIIIYKYIN